MTIANQFKFEKVNSVKKAIALAQKADSFAFLAGGTDLICNIKEGHVAPSIVIDIKDIKQLKKISYSKESKVLQIGALVTFEEIIENKTIQKLFPLLAEAALTVASQGIRNRATMVGNICSAVPCLDSGAPLVVYDATVHVVGINGISREININDWFVGPRKTALKNSELVTHLSIALPEGEHKSNYQKLGRYQGEDLAQATVAVIVNTESKNVKISFGSVAPTPIRAKKIENFLNGKTKEELLSKDVIEKAQELVASEISPITDIRATKEYRLHMCKVMLEKALRKSL